MATSGPGRRTEAHLEPDGTPPAPGDLELVRAFLSLHDHVVGTRGSVAPAGSTIAWWLRTSGLLASDADPSQRELRWAGGVLEALRTRVLENTGSPRDEGAMRTLDGAARDAGLQIRFGSQTPLPSTAGVRGAVGRILGIAFVAELDGSWSRFKECSSPTCRSVFWDRTKNGSGRWCTMRECGNRAKVRAYRARGRTTA
jgi:hypothetical protein